jgi:ubiquinone/menaquinone biosynthesis C-methylase UbiE
MLRRFYFNYVYNPVYDLTVAHISFYQRLQRSCIRKLEFQDNDRVLCVGIGTGNEIIPILKMNKNVSIVGVDDSETALRRAYRKALKQGKEIEVLRMDAHKLDFEDETFDKVSCVHLMDFLGDSRMATEEIIRVLRGGGQFVITYPSEQVGLKELAGGIKRSVCNNFRSRNWLAAVGEFLAAVGAEIAYMPLSLSGKPKHGFHSLESLGEMFAELKVRSYQIEEDSFFQEMIVYGRK